MPCSARLFRFLWLALPATLLAAPPDQAEWFEKQVRPLLAQQCYGCHTQSQSGGLRLDSRAAVLKGGLSGPAVVPGKPEDSLLIKAVSHTHERLRMPPPGKLSNEQISTLTQWVRDGAVWPETPAEYFTSTVRPVLEQNCFACHSAMAQAGLKLDSREAILKGGVTGPAMVPGDPARSLLLHLVKEGQGARQMPPGKKLSEGQVATLERWIREGAVWSDAPAPKAPMPEMPLTAEQRAFWSFQPVKDTPPPSLRQAVAVPHPIDRFIQAKLEQKGLTAAPAASKRALLRRASFDLTGLPPSPQEMQAFLADNSPQAFAKAVDRLLESPRYGERWGRHWLDLVRYADSAGDSADYPVPQARLYRDYVIEAFQKDKPYDEFLREQIAGDLLPASSEAARWEQIVATGYIATARRFSVRPERNMHLTVDDTIDNLGKVVLGLSVGCARCHDHKYDPISSKDYYALSAFFHSTRYPFAGSENTQRQLDFIPRLPKEELDRLLAPYRVKLDPATKHLEDLIAERIAAVRMRGVKEGVPPRALPDIDADIKTATADRAAILMSMPPIEDAYAVAEGQPKEGKVLLRGEPNTPGDTVPRRFLRVLGGQPLPPSETGSGREQLAAWLTDPHNPLTARVMVNRIWQQHFGKGLVATPNDFGKRGGRPTHPELLDWLAARFIENGWSVKAMHRLILSSQAYQRTSDVRNAEADPANELLSHQNRRRLDAESLRDALLLVSGQLNLARPQEHPFPHSATWAFTQHKPFNAVYDSNHRSVFLMTQRIQKHPYLAMFDGPDNNVTTAERTATITPIQALYMMNSEAVHEAAGRLAAQITAQPGTAQQHLQQAHLLLLGRPPAPEELTEAASYLAKAQTSAGSEANAFASYLRALLASNEFLYVD